MPTYENFKYLKVVYLKSILRGLYVYNTKIQVAKYDIIK